MNAYEELEHRDGIQTGPAVIIGPPPPRRISESDYTIHAPLCDCCRAKVTMRRLEVEGRVADWNYRQRVRGQVAELETGHRQEVAQCAAEPAGWGGGILLGHKPQGRWVDLDKLTPTERDIVIQHLVEGTWKGGTFHCMHMPDNTVYLPGGPSPFYDRVAVGAQHNANWHHGNPYQPKRTAPLHLHTRGDRQVADIDAELVK